MRAGRTGWPRTAEGYPAHPFRLPDSGSDRAGATAPTFSIGVAGLAHRRGLVAFAGFLRRHGLAPSSLWFDDAWVAAGASIAQWPQVLSTGAFSPGFSLLLRPFIALGGNESVVAQALPLMAGALAPALTFLMLSERGCRRAIALTAAFASASAPMHVRYSVFVKQYTVEALLSVALIWCVWTIVSDGYSRRRWVRLLIVVGVSFAISVPVFPVIVGSMSVALWYGVKAAEDRGWVALTTAATAACGLVWGLFIVVDVGD